MKPGTKRLIGTNPYTLRDFIRESNRIEGILREPTKREVEAHRSFLGLEELRVADVEGLVDRLCGNPLRDRTGRNVYVGSHTPPPGGPHIREDLGALLENINEGTPTPYEAHVAYEKLHPFMDGNGRSGRAIWAWMMLSERRYDPFSLGFLHRFYYQTLEASRA